MQRITRLLLRQFVSFFTGCGPTYGSGDEDAQPSGSGQVQSGHRGMLEISRVGSVGVFKKSHGTGWVTLIRPDRTLPARTDPSREILGQNNPIPIPTSLSPKSWGALLQGFKRPLRYIRGRGKQGCVRCLVHLLPSLAQHRHRVSLISIVFCGFMGFIRYRCT